MKLRRRKEFLKEFSFRRSGKKTIHFLAFLGKKFAICDFFPQEIGRKELFCSFNKMKQACQMSRL